MARYIALIKFTEFGSKEIKRSTGRAHSFQKIAARAGVTVEAQYWTLGDYDGVLIVSAPTERKALHCLAKLASYGAVQTETMPAYTDKEFDAILRT
jgi:uncharacterized protein with GYD domain